MASDLELSERRDAYVDAVAVFRDALQEQHDKALRLQYLSSPGPLKSAADTKARLELNAVEFLDSLETYIEYLDEFAEFVKAAFERIAAEEEAG